jgi:hypothetical protein
MFLRTSTEGDSAMKLFASWYNNAGEDDMVHVLNIRCNREEAASHTLDWRSKRQLTDFLVECGRLRPAGCDCSHCRADWDCCGSMIVSFRTVKRVRRGLKITTHFSRNV